MNLFAVQDWILCSLKMQLLIWSRLVKLIVIMSLLVVGAERITLNNVISMIEGDLIFFNFEIKETAATLFKYDIFELPYQTTKFLNNL